MVSKKKAGSAITFDRGVTSDEYLAEIASILAAGVVGARIPDHALAALAKLGGHIASLVQLIERERDERPVISDAQIADAVDALHRYGTADELGSDQSVIVSTLKGIALDDVGPTVVGLLPLHVTHADRARILTMILRGQIELLRRGLPADHAEIEQVLSFLEERAGRADFAEVPESSFSLKVAK